MWRTARLLLVSLGAVVGCDSLHGHCGDSTLVPGATDMLMSWQFDVSGTAGVTSRGVAWRGSFGDRRTASVVVDDAGDAEAAAQPDAADASVHVAAAATCSVINFVGRFTDDGKGALSLWIACAVGDDRVTFELAIPDARPLASGAMKALPSGIVVTHAGTNCLFVPRAGGALASMRVNRGVGTGAPSPSFVTADFSRDLHIVLHMTADQLEADADAGATSCVPPESAEVDATITLTAENYRQARDLDDSRCSHGGTAPPWLPKLPL